MKTFLFASLLAATALVSASAQAEPYCREYTNHVKVGGKLKESYGTACMQPDGSWQVVKPAESEPDENEIAAPQPPFAQPQVLNAPPPQVVYQQAPAVVYEEPEYYAAEPSYFAFGFSSHDRHYGRWNDGGRRGWDQRGGWGRGGRW